MSLTDEWFENDMNKIKKIYSLIENMKKILLLVLPMLFLSGCEKPNIDVNNCLNLKPIIQKDFNLSNSDAYQENCSERSDCDVMALENKLIDIFYSSWDKTCYIWQEKIGIEGINYYEINAIQATNTWYEYIWEPIFSNFCISEDLYSRSIDPDILTGTNLEKDKQEKICDYASIKLEEKLKNEIQRLK